MFPQLMRVLWCQPVAGTELRNNSEPGPIAGEKAGPEGEGAMGGDGVLTGGEESKVQPTALLSAQVSLLSTAS